MTADYAYRKPRTLSAEEAAARASRNGVTPPRGALATSAEARAAAPVPGPVKGAVKVDAFPDRSKYPFRQIADDGGVWCIDPAAYKAKAASVYTAARKWAEGNGLAVEALVHEGQVYVQFARPESGE